MNKKVYVFFSLTTFANFHLEPLFRVTWILLEKNGREKIPTDNSEVLESLFADKLFICTQA